MLWSLKPLVHLFFKNICYCKINFKMEVVIFQLHFGMPSAKFAWLQDKIFIDSTHAQIQISWLVSFSNFRKLKLEQSLENTLGFLCHFLVWFGFLSLHEKKIKTLLTFQKVAGLAECTSRSSPLAYPLQFSWSLDTHSPTHLFPSSNSHFFSHSETKWFRQESRTQGIRFPSSFPAKWVPIGGKHQENP